MAGIHSSEFSSAGTSEFSSAGSNEFSSGFSGEFLMWFSCETSGPICTSKIHLKIHAVFHDHHVLLSLLLLFAAAAVGSVAA